MTVSLIGLYFCNQYFYFKLVFPAYLIHFTSCLLFSCAHVYLSNLPVELYVIFNHPMIVSLVVYSCLII